jgi:hypothetical protein
VLCEINVSSVAPYPESAVPFVVEATLARLRALRLHNILPNIGTSDGAFGARDP